MKRNIITIATVLILIATAISATVYIADHKDKVLMKVISQSLNAGHYQPKEMNDEFSSNVFHLFLKRVDYNKRFLLQEDIDQLKVYENKIDDQVKNRDFTFFNKTEAILKQRLKEAKEIYPDILAAPFDFTKQEDFEIDPEKRPYMSTKEELKELWRKYLKFETLKKLYQAHELNKSAKEKNDTVIEIKNFEQLEKEAREKVLKTQNDFFARIEKLEKKDWMNTYFNTITNVYGPHTGYYPPKDKENFDISMSGKFEGIGASLRETPDGYIKVVKIIPGSAAARQGELQAKDVILKVAQGDEEPVDVVGMRIDEVVQLIRGKKGTEVQLTVKKLDGNIEVIPIVRDVVVLESTYARSVILKENKDNDVIGYINLPKFYADFKNRRGRRCSKDVAKEIEKLKKHDIDGLILDLRNNGGGSLADVVDMAGLFIEEGPVVQAKTRLGPANIYRDDDKRIQWEGELVILVNSFSASASEILAAAIQDYNRGIIAGSQTFGKGTVQRFLDLDQFVSNDDSDVKPLGALKLTIQKFYRINGGATQIKGVIPDIKLPDLYSHIEVGEKEQEFYMPWSEIAPVKYKEWKKIRNKKKVVDQSEKRVKKNETFDLITERALFLKKQQEKTLYPLNFEKYISLEEKREAKSKKFENIQKEKTGLDIVLLQEDIEKAKKDSLKYKTLKSWEKELEKDVYIKEAYAIVKDIK